MPSFKLASAGDDVKLWDCHTFDRLKQYNPHDQNVSALSWSNDASWLASASALDNKIALSCVKNGSVATISLDCEEGQTCVEYDSSARHLISGGISGTVKIWDVKMRKAKKTFKDHKSTLTSACFNHNDTCIASGSETGEIIINNVVSGFGSSPLVAPKTQAVCQLQFKKSLLGAVYDSGSVCLWDTNTRRLIHMFTNVHRAPATGITFSPLNEMLMMTVGLDKRLVFYDVVSKETLKVIEIDSPLTAIDLMHDGFTLAVGSTRGKLTVYDLRQSSSPITSFTAHKSSIQSLKFQPGNKSNQSDLSNEKMNKLNRRHLPPAPRDSAQVNPVTFINDSSEPQAINVEEHLSTSAGVEDIFSPVREGHNHSSNMEIRSSVGNHSSVQNHSKSSFGCNSSLQNLSQGVFSPIGGNSSLSQKQKMEQMSSQLIHDSNDSSYTVHQQRNVQAMGDRSSTYDSHQHIPNGSVQQPEQPYEDSLPTSVLEHSRQISPTNMDVPHTSVPVTQVMHGNHSHVDSMDANSVDDDDRRGHHSEDRVVPTPSRGSSANHRPPRSARTSRSIASPVGDGVTDSPMTHVREMVKDAIRTCNEHMQEELKAMWRKANDQRSSISRRDGSNSQIESSVFQTEFLRGIVQEELEGFRAESHRDLQALHVEMLRQFQIQQAEISSLLQQYSVNRELVAEVERLREENARLKKYF
ncbi:protein NEDD1-like isoform X2 [Gigantopelta aegis]|uniref:protein NEDD1-like isoform X2 n=1 Tax=Gigantopelta aegis TaxID=1735272 RepID=UPI001B8888C9|nr:protein NEDD1-like isoform X2 [Gigantopelta aegis]